MSRLVAHSCNAALDTPNISQIMISRQGIYNSRRGQSSCGRSQCLCSEGIQTPRRQGRHRWKISLTTPPLNPLEVQVRLSRPSRDRCQTSHPSYVLRQQHRACRLQARRRFSGFWQRPHYCQGLVSLSYRGRMRAGLERQPNTQFRNNRVPNNRPVKSTVGKNEHQFGHYGDREVSLRKLQIYEGHACGYLGLLK
jgi:hypothetical protein